MAVEGSGIATKGVVFAKAATSALTPSAVKLVKSLTPSLRLFGSLSKLKRRRGPGKVPPAPNPEFTSSPGSDPAGQYAAKTSGPMVASI